MGIRDAVKTPTFWLLCGVFSICGGTANGLIGTHLLPHALENGFDKVTVASAIGLMGNHEHPRNPVLRLGWLTVSIPGN